jgi:hypothetical protein
VRAPVGTNTGGHRRKGGTWAHAARAALEVGQCYILDGNRQCSLISQTALNESRELGKACRAVAG